MWHVHTTPLLDSFCMPSVYKSVNCREAHHWQWLGGAYIAPPHINLLGNVRLWWLDKLTHFINWLIDSTHHSFAASQSLLKAWVAFMHSALYTMTQAVAIIEECVHSKSELEGRFAVIMYLYTLQALVHNSHQHHGNIPHANFGHVPTCSSARSGLRKDNANSLWNMGGASSCTLLLSAYTCH
jgi:hypothetical protein